MLNKNDIRGFAFMLPLLAIVILMAVLAKPSTGYSGRVKSHADEKVARTGDTLFRFDPNTATYEELRMLGLSQTAAATVISRQRNGLTFDVPERLAAVYGVDDSLFFRLRPYIDIAEEFRAKPRRDYRRTYEYRDNRRTENRRQIKYAPFAIDTVTVEGLAGMGFTVRQATTIINYRNACGGIRTLDELARCYAVDSAMLDSLARYVVFPAGDADAEPREERKLFPVDINTADSATLRRVRGIGERTVVGILEYRRRLGGFADIGQLAEVEGVTESNFERISEQICCDTCVISKIDINFADPKRLCLHPYLENKVRKIGKLRNLKGGWSNIEEMVDDEIFTTKEAEKVRPYLRFTQHPKD